jgi:hypothetical protein
MTVPERKVSPTYLRFRESHHAIARMFAAGLTISKVAHETGYSRRRLHILLSDPTFQNLIGELAQSVDEKLDEGMDYFAERYTGAMRRAVDQIADSLEEADDAGERLPMRELLAIVKDAADRFGYSAKTVRVNVDASFAVRLENAINRTEKVIEARPVDQSSPVPSQLAEPRQLERATETASARAPARDLRRFPSPGSFLRLRTA